MKLRVFTTQSLDSQQRTVFTAKETIKHWAYCYDNNDVLYDPTSIVITILNPDEATYEAYAAAMTKYATGIYYHSLMTAPTDNYGDYRYEVQVTYNGVISVKSGIFTLDESSTTPKPTLATIPVTPFQPTIASQTTNDVIAFDSNVWKNVPASTLFNGCTSGAVFPVSPSEGTFFLHEITGRKVLYQYVNSAWREKESHGQVDVYVDPVDGTDDLNHGYGIGVYAFKTLTYALNHMPPLIMEGSYYIHFAAGTYADNYEITGHLLTGGSGYYSIYLVGTLTKVADLTATGNGVKGATTALPTFVQTGMTGSAYKEKLLYFTSGSNNGLLKIIDDNTTTTITLASQTLTAQPTTSDTASVYDWGTVFSGNVISGRGQKNVIFEYIKVTGQFDNHMNGLLSLIACNCVDFRVHDYSKSWIYDSLFLSAVSSPLRPAGMGLVYMLGGKVRATGVTGITVADQGSIYLMGGVVVDTCQIGVSVSMASFINTVATDVYNVVKNNTLYGIYASNGGQAIGTAWTVFTNNGGGVLFDKVPIPASFGYTD
jgi:hypothetical protein